MGNGANIHRKLAILLVLLANPAIADIGDTVFTGDVTCKELTLNLAQDFAFRQRATALTIQGQSSGLSSEYEFYTASGDSTDNLWIRLYAHGLPTDSTDAEYLIFGFYPNHSAWVIQSGEQQSGTLWPIKLGFWADPNVLVINTDGTVSTDGDMTITEGKLTIKGVISGGQSPPSNPLGVYFNDTSFNANDTGAIVFYQPSASSARLNIYMDIDNDGTMEIVQKFIGAKMYFLSQEGNNETYFIEHKYIGALTNDRILSINMDDKSQEINFTGMPEGQTVNFEGETALNQDLTTDANEVTFGGIVLTNTNAPVSATATGTEGQMAFDSKYIYRCVATNTWKRTLMSTWTDSYMLMETGDKVLMENGDFIILE